MTVTAGARPSKRQVGGSAPAAARGADGPLPVSAGGTGATTEPEARANLDVPGLGDTNVWTGMNTFSGGGGVAVFGTQGLEVSGTSFLGRTEWGGSYFDAPTLVLNACSLHLPYVAKTANYTLTSQDCVVNATSGSWTATLPTAVGCAGRMYIVKNSGAGTITLATTGGDTIDGAAPGTVAAGAVVRLISTGGSSWITV